MIGVPRRFDLKYNFKVIIDFVGEMDFTTCSEVAVTTGEATLWQGGSIIPVKEPTRLTFTDITLERGCSRDVDLYDWLIDTSDAALNASRMLAENYKRNAQVWQRNRMGIPVETVLLHGCWVKEYSAGDWSNDADEFRIERLVMGYDYFQRVQVNNV